MDSNTIIKAENSEAPIDIVKINYLNQFAQACHDKGMHLFIIQSPYFGKLDNIKTNQLIKRIAQQYDAIFLDYSNHARFLDKPALFQDINYLNHDGAIRFSQLVINQVAQSACK